ncbi:hypothetical protein BJ875DRAFT_523438 [Amylocarpus encephaloides]|uniref:Uncharacterized protein n=1 Tax=Amylocarpus encephaloides TaxID=45428 RepID=A0A9P8C820_9HELO|nr:hypothetical protein BJ875DRAFT_523438 [Amylocarpus encephaloides]
MDPITTLGAVVGIVQHATTALSSKAAYTLGSAVPSASDLETFSPSLNDFSRLLKDGRTYCSDHIYLSAAKNIKKCVGRYVELDKPLGKYGGSGKWKIRVRFAYREKEMGKLMARLRDSKGALILIIWNLDVEMQLPGIVCLDSLE